jgi:hypothetical protein
MRGTWCTEHGVCGTWSGVRILIRICGANNWRKVDFVGSTHQMIGGFAIKKKNRQSPMKPGITKGFKSFLNAPSCPWW